MGGDADLRDLIKKVPRVGLQLRAGEERLPLKLRVLESFDRHIDGVTAFQRAALRKIALEPRSIDFQPANMTGLPEPDDGPIMAGPAPSLGFPAVTHVSGASRHDQIVTMTEEHVAAR